MLFSFGIDHHRFSKYMKTLFEWKSKSVLHILKPQFEGSWLLQLAFCSDSLNFPCIVFPQWFKVITKTQWTLVFFSVTGQSRENKANEDREQIWRDSAFPGHLSNPPPTHSQQTEQPEKKPGPGRKTISRWKRPPSRFFGPVWSPSSWLPANKHLFPDSFLHRQTSN